MKFLTSGFFLSTIKSRDQLHFRLRNRNNVLKILKLTFPVDFTRYFQLSEEWLVLKDESIEYRIHSLIIKRCQKFCHSFRCIREIQRLRSMLQWQFRVKTIQTDGTFLILFGSMTWPYRWFMVEQFLWSTSNFPKWTPFMVPWRPARANVTRNIATRANFLANRPARKSWVNSHARTSACEPYTPFQLDPV